MPDTQTLMLHFDVTHASGQLRGQFADDGPVHRSKVWVAQGGSSQPDSQSLTVQLRDRVPVGIHVTTDVPVGWTITNLTVSAALWRTHSAGNNAIYDSPFVDASGRVCTMFEASAAGAASVDIPLGIPTLNSGRHLNSDRYLFLISVVLDVNDGTTDHRYTASQDPQMVVDM